MQYKVLAVNAVSGYSADSGLITDIPKATSELSKLVNQNIRDGWTPIGGISAGYAQQLNETFLLQAMVHE